MMNSGLRYGSKFDKSHLRYMLHINFMGTFCEISLSFILQNTIGLYS